MSYSEVKGKNKDKIFADKLLTWFKSNKRHFPWRERKDPYSVLVAEVLLRKTDAPKVLTVYENFLSKYPNSKILANASVAALEKDLEPLGLYKRRAKELKMLAEILMKKYGGQLPRAKQELLELPGVGNYIANAVLCFAYDEDLPLLDTNFIRVLKRFFGIKSLKARARTDRTLWKAAEDIIPKGEAKEFNLAMIDFASLICTAKNPRCKICPVNNLCQWRGKN